MSCKKCKKDMPEGALYCPWCGARQGTNRGGHRRGNGQGTAYKRGATWTAAVVVGWHADGIRATPIRRTRGGFKTKREALEYVSTLRQDAHAGPRSAPQLASYWTAYEQGRFTRLSPSKQSAYRTAWHKLEALAWRPVDRITVVDLQAAVAAVAPTYYTARDCRTVLTRLFEMAAAEGWVSKDLPSFVELPALDETVRKAFTGEEQVALWRLYASGDLRAGVPLLMIATGMMPGEMQALRVEHIDLKARKITGVGMKTKVRRESAILLPIDIMPVVEDLVSHAQPSGYLWPRNEPRWYVNYYDALEAAGCRRLEPYCCRHTTATRLAVSEGIAPQLIRRVMRWSTARMLDRYAHPDDQDALAAADSLRIMTTK